MNKYKVILVIGGLFILSTYASNLYAVLPQYDRSYPFAQEIYKIQHQVDQGNLYYRSYQKSKKKEYLEYAANLYKNAIVSLYNIQYRIQHVYRFFYQTQRLRINICEQYNRIKDQAYKDQTATVPALEQGYCATYPPPRTRN